MNLLRRLTKACRRPTSRRRAKPPPARLLVRSFEPRITPSTLIITGTRGDDTITLGVDSAGGISVDFNGQTSNYAAGQWSAVVVNPGGGSNNVSVNALPSAVPATVNSAAGAIDAVGLGNRNLGNLPAGVTVNGNGGDWLTVEDSAGTDGQSYSVTNNSVTTSSGFGGLSYNRAMRVELQTTTHAFVGMQNTASATGYEIFAHGR